MSAAQPDRDEARDAPPTSCEEAQRALVVFASARLEDGEHARLRAHLMRCVACREDYRHAVRSLADVGRAVRERRLAPPPMPTSRTERARTAIARAADARRRGGRFGLRLFVTTAALIVLFTLIAPDRETPLQARWTAGQVRAGDASLGPDLAQQAIVAGESCSTHGDGRATVAGAGMRAELAADTIVLVEDAEAPQLRLQHGALELEGAALVTSPTAAVRIDGRGRVEVGQGSLSAACHAGSLTVFDAAGELVLAAGESVTADVRTGRLVKN